MSRPESDPRGVVNLLTIQMCSTALRHFKGYEPPVGPGMTDFILQNVSASVISPVENDTGFIFRSRMKQMIRSGCTDTKSLTCECTMCVLVCVYSLFLLRLCCRKAWLVCTDPSRAVNYPFTQQISDYWGEFVGETHMYSTVNKSSNQYISSILHIR